VAGFCKHDDEISGLIKAGDLLINWATISFSRGQCSVELV